jgi:methionine-rich copper-binding protein CopC
LPFTPNPTNEIINFNFTEPIQAQTFITISNTLGQTVKTERIPAGQSNYTMNLSGLAAGIYVVKTESSEGVSSAKIIKQ